MEKINNEVYETLGHRWYEADDDPIALLRAETRVRNPWVMARIRRQFDGRAVDAIDLGCGGGFLANALAASGHRVVGIDQAADALRIASTKDATGRVDYRTGDIRALDYPAASFDVVCAMDVLEHVDPWQKVVVESLRVLRPGGLFFFYTFNRTFLSWLFAVKGVEWIVRNTPPRMHAYSLFIRPEELSAFVRRHGARVGEVVGLAPKVLSRPFARLLLTGRVSDTFGFRFTRSTRLAYLGVALKASGSEAELAE